MPSATQAQAGDFKDPAPPANYKRTVKCMLLSNFVMGLQWTMYLPTLSLMITTIFGESAMYVGWAFGLFTAGSIVSMILMNAVLLKMFTVRTIFLRTLYGRVVSGLIHVAACAPYCPGPWRIWLVLLSRLVHGTTQITLPLGMVFNGIHVPRGERATTVSQMMMMFVLGGVAGPQVRHTTTPKRASVRL